MRSIFRFLATTILGGVIFLVPFLILLVLVWKTFDLVRKFTRPLANQWGLNNVGGHLLILLLLLVVLGIIAFTAGYFFQTGKIRAQIPILHQLAEKIVPGYDVFKARSAEMGAQVGDESWEGILLKREEGWRIAFVVERQEGGLGTLYLPESAKFTEGEIVIVDLKGAEYISIPVKDAHRWLMTFGNGAAKAITAHLSKT